MKSAHDMPFGASLTPAGVRFAIWAPSVGDAEVVFDGRRMPMHRGAGGFLHCLADEATRISSQLLRPLRPVAARSALPCHGMRSRAGRHKTCSALLSTFVYEFRMELPQDGRRRAFIEHVRPGVDCARATPKRATGGWPAFMARATLRSSHGVYGSAFELLEHAPREPGSEEYLDSEKYELERFELSREESLRDLSTRLSASGRDNAARLHYETLTSSQIENDRLICCSRTSFIDVLLDEWSLDARDSYLAHELLSGRRHEWPGGSS